MPPVSSATAPSSASRTAAQHDISNPQDRDIWFDAIDHVEMDDTWFSCEEHQTDPSSFARDAADSRVPLTEDCRRGVQQFVRTLGEYGENKMLSACLSKILPGAPGSLVIAANSLYNAVAEGRNTDTAVLHVLGLASWYLPENSNVVSRLASFIRDTITGWTDETFLQQFLGNEENHTATHLFTALAVTAIVAGRWMKDKGAPQRGVLKVPAFMANIFIRASHYWAALGNMANSLPSGVEMQENTGPSQRAPAFEVDTRLEMTGERCDAAVICSRAPRLTAFLSNSTVSPEAYTRATVQNRPAPAPEANPRFSVPERAHSLAVEKLRQGSGLSDLVYCTSRKTEAVQQTNENIITSTYFNTKCDATGYPEPLTKGADSIPAHTGIPETQVSSAAKGRSGGDALLPLVMTGAVAMPVATSYMQALKSSKTVIAAGATAALTGAGIAGKMLWDKLATHNPEGTVDDTESNALRAKKGNRKIIDTLVNDGVLKKGKVNKESLLSAVAEYLFVNEAGMAGSTGKVRTLARKILSTEGLYGGENNEKLSEIQAKSVVRSWVFKKILGVSPDEYIINYIKKDPYPGYYTVSSIHHLLSMRELLKNKKLHYERIPPSQWGYLNAMWYAFLTEEMPFLKFSSERVKDLELRDIDFANLYSGTRFLQNAELKVFTFEEAISTGQSIWDLAVSEGVSEDKLGFYRAPAILFSATNLSKSIKKEQVTDFYFVNEYVQYRQEVREVQKDIDEKYNKYLVAAKAWMSKGKLADYIISQCPVLNSGLTDLADAIRTPEQQREKAVKAAKQAYLNGTDKPCQNAPENLSDEYHNLTANVADSFREIDRFLILSEISALPDDEIIFIQSTDATIHTATAYIQMMQTGSPLNLHKHFIERTDLFAVKRGGQERIYALKSEGNNSGYKLVRVDRDIEKYILSGIFGETFDDYKNTWNNIEDSQDINIFGVNVDEPALAGSGSRVDIITDSISKKHREHLYDALHVAGNDKSDLEKIWSVIKHLIPFYDCVEGLVNNNLEQAIPSCLMDAVSFIPVFGLAARLSGKFGMGLMRGLRSGARVVIHERVQTASRNLLREVSLPTTRELVSLGKDALRAIDPGFQLLAAAARPGRDFAKKVATLLSGSKKTPGLAQTMASEGWLARFPEAISGKLIKGKLPGTDLAVPVKVVDRLHDGRNVYVRVNPENGVLGVQKYICQKSGALKLLPAKLGKNRKIRGVWTENNLADSNIIYTRGRTKRGVMGSKLCSARSPSPDIELEPLPGPARPPESVDVPELAEPSITRDERESTRAFSKDEVEFIKEIKVNKEDGFSYIPRGNDKQNYYGNGNIYVQEKTGDPNHQYLGQYIEMNGELVPVKTIITPGHGVHYEVYNLKKPSGESYPVEWDGERWLFERKTSAHVSEDLENLISPEMISEKVGSGKLSVPDHQGLRYDADGNRYIKIKGEYIKLEHRKDLLFIRMNNGDEIYVSYAGNELKPTIVNRHNGLVSSGYNEVLKDSRINSLSGLDVRETRSLNEAWSLKGVNIKNKNFNNDNAIGSTIDVTFTMEYNKLKNNRYIEMPPLQWKEKIDLKEGDSKWHFQANMYEHNPKSMTFFPWVNRYLEAYNFAKSKDKGLFNGNVRIYKKNMEPVGVNDIKSAGTPVKKVKNIQKFLSRNGGVIEITITDVPQILKREIAAIKERKLTFDIGFKDEIEAHFNQGIRLVHDGETNVFVTTSDNIKLARGDVNVQPPERVTKPREHHFSPGEVY